MGSRWWVAVGRQANRRLDRANSQRFIFICALSIVHGFLFLLIFQTASAHAQLVAAEPSNGTTLAASPAEIHLTFNENLGADSRVTILGDNFARVAGVAVREIIFNEIFVSIPELEAGVYTVQYDVVSADNHPISGSYEFAVQPPRALSSLWTGAVFGALLALVGVAILIVRRRRLTHLSDSRQGEFPPLAQ